MNGAFYITTAFIFANVAIVMDAIVRLQPLYIVNCLSTTLVSADFKLGLDVSSMVRLLYVKPAGLYPFSANGWITTCMILQPRAFFITLWSGTTRISLRSKSER